MSSAEFCEWMRYYELHPWGADRDNLHAGIVASTIANVNGNKTKPGDFLLQTPRNQQTQQQSWEVQLAQVKKCVSDFDKVNKNKEVKIDPSGIDRSPPAR